MIETKLVRGRKTKSYSLSSSNPKKSYLRKNLYTACVDLTFLNYFSLP